MKPSTQDEIEATIHQVKGIVKEKVGQMTNNADLTAEGKAEKLAGKIQEKAGQIEKIFEG
jgi:uncharacterized protein YjbJ (UPF0337 family)